MDDGLTWQLVLPDTVGETMKSHRVQSDNNAPVEKSTEFRRNVTSPRLPRMEVHVNGTLIKYKSN